MDLWPTDSVYHSTERGGGEGEGRGRGSDGGEVREGAETQRRAAESSETSFAYRIVETDMNHLWKTLIRL